jgi:putative ABC transport system ATP-binding protein
MNPVLELRSVSRSHGAGRVQVDALIDATVTVGEGTLVAVMGPSGSGKSTLLSLAGGLDRPTTGQILVEGTSLNDMTVGELAKLRRRRIGYVFQQYNLIEGLTAVENVSLPLELDGVGKSKATDAAMQALNSVGLGDLCERFPDDCPAGNNNERLSLARSWGIGDCSWRTSPRGLSTPSPEKPSCVCCEITATREE